MNRAETHVAAVAQALRAGGPQKEFFFNSQEKEHEHEQSDQDPEHP